MRPDALQVSADRVSAVSESEGHGAGCEARAPEGLQTQAPSSDQRSMRRCDQRDMGAARPRTPRPCAPRTAATLRLARMDHFLGDGHIVHKTKNVMTPAMCARPLFGHPKPELKAGCNLRQRSCFLAPCCNRHKARCGKRPCTPAWLCRCLMVTSPMTGSLACLAALAGLAASQDWQPRNPGSTP